MSRTAKGVTLSLLSSVFFGALYYVMPFMAPFTGEAVWAVRVLFAVPLVTLILLATRELPLLGDALQRVRKKPIMILGMIATSILLAGQIWVYMWAPLNGRGLQVALGYFLFPLVMIVVGRVLYKDTLTRMQLIATLIAAAGVTFELIRVGQLSWEALLVALGYPIYFIIRKATGLNNTAGMWFDMTLMVPLATFVLFSFLRNGPSLEGSEYLTWLVPLMGVSAGAAILFFVLGAKYLSMSLFGLLSYIEPALLMLAAVLIGETVTPGEFPLYIAIWIAIALVVVDGVRQIRASRAGSYVAI